MARPAKDSVLYVRITTALKAELQEVADNSDMSVNALVNMLLVKALAEQNGE